MGHVRSRDAFRPITRAQKYLMDYKLGYLSADIICSSKLTVFFELRTQKTVSFEEQIMSADKYSSIFSLQMAATVHLDVLAGDLIIGK